jgi:hypothetical protein
MRPVPARRLGPGRRIHARRCARFRLGDLRDVFAKGNYMVKNYSVAENRLGVFNLSYTRFGYCEIRDYPTKTW